MPEIARSVVVLPAPFGPSTETTEASSSLWLGDDSWGDLIIDVQFNVGDVGLQFHAREKDGADDKPSTYDLINLPDIKKGEWCSVRIELRGSKAITLNAGRRVELIAQVFNVLNRKNLVAAWTTNALSPAFGIVR